jgi:hypothetical protein
MESWDKRENLEEEKREGEIEGGSALTPSKVGGSDLASKVGGKKSKKGGKKSKRRSRKSRKSRRSRSRK